MFLSVMPVNKAVGADIIIVKKNLQVNNFKALMLAM